MLPIAKRWFARERIDATLTRLWEPHVDPLIRCNIWHLRGRDRDLLIDTGLGIARLTQAARDLFDRDLLAVATHAHFDHIGGLHEFARRAIHRAEAPLLAGSPAWGGLTAAGYDEALRDYLQRAGYPVPDVLLDARPHAGCDPERYAVPRTAATDLLAEGMMIDLGDRAFEVLHLPGHSPGSIGLWEAETGILFSGDAVYDGPLLDRLPGGDAVRYARTARRLLALPIAVVHGGHDPSFGRARLKEILTAALARWEAA